jgi:hypothetical protein
LAAGQFDNHDHGSEFPVHFSAAPDLECAAGLFLPAVISLYLPVLPVMGCYSGSVSCLFFFAPALAAALMAALVYTIADHQDASQWA